MLLFIGIPGSGKTTFYQQRFFHTHVRISLDLLKTRRRQAMLIEACLAAGQRFIVDNTNPTCKEREYYIRRAKDSRFKVIGYFFEPDPKSAFERNQRREKKFVVPAAGLFGTLKRLERPQASEGFDELYLVRTLEGSFEIEQMH